MCYEGQYQNLKVEYNGYHLSIYIDRPDQLNALNKTTIQSLEAVFDWAVREKTDVIRVVSLRGAGGKAFVAGADIKEMQSMSEEEREDFVSLAHRTFQKIQEFPAPVVSILDGFALGGGLELALATDIILASERVKVGFPEVKLGIIPGFGGTQRIRLRCGAGMCRRLIYTGEMIDAKRAYDHGIIDMVVSADSLDEDAKKLIALFESRAPLAITEAKKLLGTYDRILISTGLEEEKKAFYRLSATGDRVEGFSAFLEKRKPHFEGK